MKGVRKKPNRGATIVVVSSTATISISGTNTSQSIPSYRYQQSRVPGTAANPHSVKNEKQDKKSNANQMREGGG